MKKYLNIAFVFILAGVFYMTGQFFSDPTQFGYCVGDQNIGELCTAQHAVRVGWPLIEVGEIFFVVAIILLFATTTAWRKWSKFSLWFVPLSALFLIYGTPINLALGQIETVDVTRWLGYIYIFITLLIVVPEWIIARKEKK